MTPRDASELAYEHEQMDNRKADLAGMLKWLKQPQLEHPKLGDTPSHGHPRIKCSEWEVFVPADLVEDIVRTLLADIAKRMAEIEAMFKPIPSTTKEKK